MAEGSAATAAAASAPGLRAGGRGGGRPWGRKAEGGRRRAGGGRGGGRRGEGAGAAAAAAGFPASSPRCAPRSLGRCSPRRPASPRLGHPLWPRLLPPSGPALRFPLPPAPPPPSTQIPTPHPEPRSRRRRRRHTPLRLGLARLPRWPRPAPPRSHSPAGPLAPPPLPIDLPVRHRDPAHSPGLLPDWGRRGGPRARWLAAARDVSAQPPPPPPPPPPPRVAWLPPSAVPQQRNPPPRARGTLGSGASPLQPPPREPVSGARPPAPRGRGPAGQGGAGRARGLGRRSARGPRGGAGGARGAARAPNKVCFDEKRLCFLFRVGRRLLVAPGSRRAMAATGNLWLITGIFSILSCFCLIKLQPLDQPTFVSILLESWGPLEETPLTLLLEENWRDPDWFV
ncbi:uncharacterized protein [Callorhinus ursinus]|uniref:uncharacterized protein isoform X2 n=1 Tax=Callorhinus ursinus TaxID=34884 RepID=UPI003CD00DCE